MTPDLPLQILLSCQSEPRRTKVGAALQFLGPADIRVVGDRHTAMAWLDRITFDLVVMDFHAPELNALEVVRHMRHHTISRHTPALLCMNAATERDHTLAWQAGITDLVIEPFESETMLRAIWRIPALSRRLAARARPRRDDVGEDSRNGCDNMESPAGCVADDRDPQGVSDATPARAGDARTGPAIRDEQIRPVGLNSAMAPALPVPMGNVNE